MSFNALLLCYQRNINVFRIGKIKPLIMFLTVLTAVLFLSLPATLSAQTITYAGDASDLSNVSWLSPTTAQNLFPSSDVGPLLSNNKVVVDYINGTAATTNPYYLFGGLSNLEDVTGNSVEIVNGLINRSAFGGYTVEGNAEYNAITMSGGQVSLDLQGGYSSTGDAIYNTVTLSGGTVSFDVIGGTSDVWSRGDKAEYNSVFISGGAVGNNVYGGWSYYGSASNNRVVISGGVMSTDVYGGFGSNTGNAENNIVAIGGGVVVGGVVGGYSDSGNVEGNIVTLSDGDVGDIFGGFTWGNANIAHNNVIMSGGNVGSFVVGGYSDAGGNVEYNGVTISGGEVGAAVFGGWSVSGNATYNTVTIEGSPILTNTDILGGISGAGDYFTGNTLNIKSSNIAVNGVANFEFYNFYLSTSTTANDSILTVAEEVDLTGATVGLYLQGNTALRTGDRVTLINSSSEVRNYTASASSAAATSSTQASLGAFLTYNFDIFAETNSLLAELTAISTSSSTKALTNARLAPLAFLNQGADMTEYLARLEVTGNDRYTAFAMVGGGSSTYDTGSDVEVKGASLLAGVTWDANISKNSLTMGAFIEAGWGSYDTDNSFGGMSIRGSGDMDYYGGGLYVRHLWESGLYADASLRVGRITTDFDSSDIDVSGTLFSYDSGSTYYGAHAGLGYSWRLNAKNRLEASGKYIWTHLDSDKFTSSSGDEIRFDSANSHRLRAGLRIYHDYGNANAVTLYYGAAYEYEFDGDAAGRLYGAYALDGSSLSGGSGIGELGVMFRPSKDNDRLMMQLGAQGYVGAREGVSGSLKLQYAF